MSPAHLRRTRRAGWVAVAGLAALVGCGDGGPAVPATGSTVPTAPRPAAVVVDYSPTLSDAGALLYLAMQPDVELRAVTLAGTGESTCAAGVLTTRRLLAAAGRADVPVACGRTEPLGPGHAWPADWRAAADALLDPLPTDLLAELDAAAPAAAPAAAGAADAVGLLGAVADGSASGDGGLAVIALAPLTNLAEAVSEHPRLVDAVSMVYVMGGALSAPGNAPGGAAEWNLYADPTAADVVVRSGLPLTFVPLDATAFVPADRGVYRRLAELAGDDAAAPAARVLAALWEAQEPWAHGMSLWDELTAVLALEPGLSTVGALRVSVATDGGAAGRLVTDPDGTEVRVVGRPDRRAVEAELVGALAADGSS